MKKIIILLIVFGFFFSLIPSINAIPDYTIDNDTVYIDDSNVYLSANPHTLNKSGWVEFQLNSKNYEGLIDVIFGFNTSNSKPISAEIWKNDNWENLDRNFNVLNYDYQNFNKWYILNDVDINKNQLYKLRCFIYAKRGTNGKYFYGVKPSSETFVGAFNNNHFYIIDPWWNITYNDVEGHWHLNETTGNIAYDSSPNEYDGINIDMENEDWVCGKLNNCLNFDGINEHVNLNNVARFERTDNFSVECWFKTSISETMAIIGNRGHTGGQRGWQLQLISDELYFILHSTTGNGIKVHINGIRTDGEYHHTIVTYDGSSSAVNVKFYIDGVLKTTVVDTDTLTGSIISTSNTQISGRDGDNLCFNGNIDEVVIYNKELTQSEVEVRYNDGDGREDVEDIIFGNLPNKPICIQPIDKTMNINIDTTLKTKVVDIDNDIMNVSFYLDDILLENFNNITNNTIVESSNLSLDYSRIYTWYVVVKDETYSTQSDTFIFSTESEPDPIIPNIPPEKPILISPDNNSINVSKFIKLKAHVNDIDDDFVYVSFYLENNSEIQCLFSIVNYTIQTSTLNLEYNTTYSWYVVVTDFIDYNISDIYTFTTEIEPVDDDIEPPTPVEMDYSILLIGVCLAIIVFILEFFSNKLKIEKTNLLSAIELVLVLIIISIMIFLKFT